MAGLPTKQDLLLWLKDNPDKISKREIAKAFGITGSDKIDLKKLILDLENEEEISIKPSSESLVSAIPSTAICIAKAPDKDGDIFWIYLIFLIEKRCQKYFILRKGQLHQYLQVIEFCAR